jgi:hypothetical protein
LNFTLAFVLALAWETRALRAFSLSRVLLMYKALAIYKNGLFIHSFIRK